MATVQMTSRDDQLTLRPLHYTTQPTSAGMAKDGKLLVIWKPATTALAVGDVLRTNEFQINSEIVSVEIHASDTVSFDVGTTGKTPDPTYWGAAVAVAAGGGRVRAAGPKAFPYVIKARREALTLTAKAAVPAGTRVAVIVHYLPGEA